MKSRFGWWVSFVPAFLLLTSAARADDSAAERNSEEVKKQFTAGVNLLEDPDGAKYEEAYHAFKKAYELSGSPKVLGNVGYCAFHLERDGEAIDAYTRYLQDVPDVSPSERVQIQRDLATLTSTVGTLRVVVKRPPGFFVLIDTRTQTRGPSVENSYSFEGTEISLRVRPGRHTLKVKATDAESLPYDRTLDAGGVASLDVAFPAPTPARPEAPPVVRSSPSHAGPIFFGVAGFLAVGAGVTSGLLARSKTSDIEKECPNDVCPATYDLDTNKDTAKLFGTVADIALISGGAFLATAAVWYLLPAKSRSSRAIGLGSPSVRSGMMCTGSGCAFHVGQAF